MKKLLLFIALSITIGACGPTQNKNVKIHCYRSKTRSAIYKVFMNWYMLRGQNNICYYYSSMYPMSNFSNLPWIPWAGIPDEIQQAEELAYFEEPLSEIPHDIRRNICESEISEPESSAQDQQDDNDSGGDASDSGDLGVRYDDGDL